ncbi:hypothetical protein ACOI1H_22700 [Loktanella sp. DJP18]|uniref:hypothetical protein n=1 Tax=Loktanella sp. DJP18 TaxID=3409788 RepID=UPI003BB51DD2
MLVNFCGAPGSGKTTMMAGAFFELKAAGWDVETISEASKEKIYEKDLFSLSDEILIFAEKYRRVLRLAGTDIKLTDTSLRQSAYYAEGKFGPIGEQFFRNVADGFDNIYIIVDRVHPYIPKGRMQDPSDADKAGVEIISDIMSSGSPVITVDGHRTSLEAIIAFITEQAQLRGLASAA